MNNSKEMLQWVPIENKTPSEVVKLLLKSKVYVDFREHPGKDRFPGEAAICGCCIITGKKGSAGNPIDIPISENYKFENDEGQLDLIIEKARDILVSFDKRSQDFDDYRERKFLRKIFLQ